jgi:hypothetical protein
MTCMRRLMRRLSEIRIDTINAYGDRNGIAIMSNRVDI